MFGQEKNNLEFKENITKTFLKTVSAFSNYYDGRVIFGVSNNGEVKGLKHVKDAALKIEHMINDSITPRPSYKLGVGDDGGRQYIVLEITKGKDAPYYYKSRAYKRSDTSTVEVDRIELNRLVMEGFNLDYEENKAHRQDLKFTVLEKKLMSAVGIEKLTTDILKTLKLYDKEGYFNVAGELFADENDYDLQGIDIVKFGKNINQILYRETLTNMSILSLYDKAIEMFERYYQYEEIEGYKRVKKELIPREAFREAIANGIIHREWDIRSHIQISMYDNRIEIKSPGGLPKGISEEDYLYEQVSILRNPITAGVFYRLNLIEKFGTGVRKIVQAYNKSITKPDFKISANYISVTLPVLDQEKSSLSGDEAIIYKAIDAKGKLNRRDLDIRTGFNKSKTLRILNSLQEKNIIKKEGSGSRVIYSIISAD